MFRLKTHARVAALLLTISVAVATSQDRTNLDPTQLYRQVQASVVLIEVYGADGKVTKTGSGFVVSADGRLLTNYHVIAHAKQATVRLANGDAYDAVEAVSIDKRKDIIDNGQSDERYA